jgi:hypothetical protein
MCKLGKTSGANRTNEIVINSSMLGRKFAPKAPSRSWLT